MLKVTMKELYNIIKCNRFTDKFKVLHDGLPKPTIDDFETYNSNDYREDDGREYWVANFEDKETGEFFEVNYTQYEHYEFGEGIFDHSDNIEIVSKSVLKKVDDVKETPKEVVTEKSDLELIQDQMEILEKNKQLKMFDINRTTISKEEIKDVVSFINQGNFTILQLRAKIFPICLKHKTDTNSFWHYIQTNK